jgi:LytR cell envelope-related transcriptional attenuator/Tetratricopeptide repeat
MCELPAGCGSLGRRRRRPTVLAALTLLLLSGCASLEREVQPVLKGTAAAPVATQPEGYLRGRHHLAGGRLGLALAEFRSALRRDPSSVSTLNATAVTYDLLGRFDLAAHYYQRALAHEPKSAQVLNNFGRSLLRQGRSDLALGYLEQAQRIGPADAIIQHNLELARGFDSAADGAVTQAAAGAPAFHSVWVERTTYRTQTLVTSGPSESPQADPRLVYVVAAPTEPAGGMAVAREVTLEVSNGAGRRHMADRCRSFLATHGIGTNRLTNASHFNFRRSVILYRPGFEEEARRLANLLPPGVALHQTSSQRSDVRLRLGADLLEFDDDLVARSLTS